MRTKNVKKSYDDAKINEKWASTLWAQKIAKKQLVGFSFSCQLSQGSLPSLRGTAALDEIDYQLR